jgi:hypothetical protein
MPVERSHDRLYPVAPRPDELPNGVSGPLAPTQDEHTSERRPDGTWAKGARTAQRKGGNATRGRTRLADRLGLAKLAEGAAFAPYKLAAVTFRRAQCAELSRTVGGGMCGPGPSSMVASAALQLAWSRYLSDLAASTGDPALALSASKLADASRNNLLSAHELAAREAQARPKAPLSLAARLLGEEPKS